MLLLTSNNHAMPQAPPLATLKSLIIGRISEQGCVFSFWRTFLPFVVMRLMMIFSEAFALLLLLLVLNDFGSPFWCVQ
jgi:hypothetical protein